MNKKQFFIELKSELSQRDFSNLRLLYTPIIGLKATMLFQTLFDYFDLNKESRTFYSLVEFKLVLNLNELELEKARKKLEATGLLRTFEKGDNRTFIFRLNPPLTPSAFKQNKFLYSKIINATNELYFERIELNRKERYIAKVEYTEITTKYQDMFDLEVIENNLQNTLEIALPSVKSKTDAITSLVPPQFTFYLTKKRVSPSQLRIFQNLQNQGLSSEALNTIIDYSFTINNKIVANHIKKIAEDFIEKDFKDVYSITVELKAALESKAGQNKQAPIYELETKQENNQDWNDIFKSIGSI